MVLTPSRFKTFSEITRDIGQIFFASVFVSPLISGDGSLPLIISGLLLSFVFWAISLLLVK